MLAHTLGNPFDIAKVLAFCKRSFDTENPKFIGPEGASRSLVFVLDRGIV